MSTMEIKEISIYEAMENIKNRKYVIPAFQREFVWRREQIEKLWDSILLDYPIATFLFWHLDDNNMSNDTLFGDFLTEAKFRNGKPKKDEAVAYRLSQIDLSHTDTAVLDGQQRLTSLYLSLCGDAYFLPKGTKWKNQGIPSKLLIELDEQELNDLEQNDDEDLPRKQYEFNNKKYGISFTSDITPISTQFEIKKLFTDEFRNQDTRAAAIENAIRRVPSASKEYARNLLNKLCTKIYDEKLIRYLEITDMYQEDALEMFVRFNSGGTALKKSDITISILHAYWTSAKEKFDEVLRGEYADFGTDFIIRSALMLYGEVLKSNINKKAADSLKNNWEDFKSTLQKVEQLLAGMNIKVSRFASSWNVLLPVIYSVHNNPDYLEDADGIKAYLARAVLFTYFQSGTTQKLNTIGKAFAKNDFRITVDILDQIKGLNVTEDGIATILDSEKGGRIAKEALYFLGLDWVGATNYEQDHLHADRWFKGNRPGNITQETWFEWVKKHNKLPNLQFLVKRQNGDKGAMTLQDYYDDLDENNKAAFKHQAMIPEGASLDFNDFGDFYEKRKALLADKLRDLFGK